jgi:hypothetical protein
MVNSNTDGSQPKPHCGNAAGRGGGAVHHPIRDETIDRIRSVPEVAEIGLLQVIQKGVVTGKGIGHRGHRRRRRACLGGRVHRRDLVIIGLPVADVKITEPQCRQQAGVLLDERAAT